MNFRKFLDWKKIGMPAVLPMTLVTLNEIYHLGSATYFLLYVITYDLNDW